MKTITILCGLPRSGKSTWLKENKTNEVVVSADDIRFLTYGQRFWADGEGLVWHIRGMMLKYLLSQGVDVIIDETNLTAKSRANVITLAKVNGYKIKGVLFTTCRMLCKQRAVESGQEDLISVIERMYPQFEHPKTEEGFDELINV